MKTTVQKIVNDKCFILADIITRFRIAKVSENDILMKKYKSELFRFRMLREILNDFYA